MTEAQMSTPVTRGELRAELGELRTDLRAEIGEVKTELRAEIAGVKNELRAEIAGVKTELRTEIVGVKTELRAEIAELRTEVHVLGGALLARIEQNEHALRATEQRLSGELAHHARAIQESLQAHLTAFDEKYADLPGRMSRVEAVVFPTGSRGNRRRS